MSLGLLLGLLLFLAAPALAAPSGTFFCGDGSVDGVEQCDDGNTTNGDCCSSNCQYEFGSCDDQDACTSSDSCDGFGHCSGVPVVCDTPPDQCYEAVGSCFAGKCSYDPKPDSISCDDSDPCTLGDHCDGAGGCASGDPNTCNDNNPCTADACDPFTGICGYTDAPGEPCDDGNPCTINDACGFPTGGQTLSVSQCIGQVQNGAPCNDGNSCTTGESCDPQGLCGGGQPTSCDDADPCTLDTCDPAHGCAHPRAPTGTPCNDGNPCTTGDHCENPTCATGSCLDIPTGCVGGAPTNCNDNNECTLDSCDPASGCAHQPRIGAPCNDGSVCTPGVDICNPLGQCVGSGPPINCNDNAACTQDTCDPIRGCIYNPAPAGTPCDDGNACTANDRCEGPAFGDDCLTPGGCTNPVAPCIGQPVNCNDNNPCTADSCNPSSGCVHTPTPGAACSDANACTVGDVCSAAGQCTPGSPANCDDHDQCTLDSCNPATGCLNPATPGAICNDGDACTIGDRCSSNLGGGASICLGTQPRNCNDNNACTADSCSSATGCVNAPTPGTSCDDGNACTTGDTCSATGTCSGSDHGLPSIGNLSANPAFLWPPNHTMRNVSVNYTASDNCGGQVTCQITQITSNEPVNGTGDGDTAPDWAIVDGQHVQLRAERAGGGTGRIYTLTVRCADASGNATTSTTTVQVKHDIGSPKSGAAFRVGSTVSFAGAFWDVLGRTHTAQWFFDSLSKPGAVTEPAASRPGAVTGSYTFTAAGVYAVKMKLTDTSGVSSEADAVDGVNDLVVVYDPNGGYVTGGGWADSPAGALRSNPSVVGRVNFGFVSKYFGNATNPKGETEFDFRLAGFKFNALNFDYLVVSGAKAQYKGAGKVNGSGGYQFLLSVIDGQAPGGGGVDKFRIKIWVKTSGAIVYDSQMGAADNADPTTAVGAGSNIILQP